MKAVIFDMDGVIIDSEPVHQKVEEELVEELGGSLTAADKEAFVGTTDYHMWSTMKERFDLTPTVEKMIELKKERFLNQLQSIPLVDGFKDVLELLTKEGYLIGLASSNNRQAVDEIIEMFGLSKYLQVAMSGEDVERGKPHPEIFLKTAKIMSVDPENCVVIEDAKNGIKAANAAGMKSIGFDNPNSGQQNLSEADLILDDYEAFELEVIERLFD